MRNVRGTCLCGAVEFAIDGDPLRVVHCHCSRCRKVRGTGHATNFAIAADAVRFVRGDDRLTTYRPPEAKRFAHAFCRECGSSMPFINRELGIAVVPMGSLDDDPGPECRPTAHIFVGSKAPWDDITDDLPRHADGLPAK